jgi:8-oxo-dGTP pyrophosphatase MutT (NUDIX family)
VSTTAIVAEILIIGLQTLSVLFVALVIVAGDRALGEAVAIWQQMVVAWKDLVPILTILLLAFAYSVGTVFDRVADFVDDRVPFGASRSALRVRVRRMDVMQKSAEITKFLEYQRSRLRIGRATYLNLFVLLGLLLGIDVFGRPRPDVPIVALIVVTACALVLTFAAWAALDRTYVRALDDATRVVQPNGWLVDVAAAVCYQRTDSGVQLLLVKTKGETWTFPKGHVKSGETGQSAAQREAREEAGATGSADKDPFAAYGYPKKRRHGRRIDLVHAYLLRVVDTSTDHEDWREPKWWTPEEAEKKLAEGQEEWYAKEISGVLALALARLSQAQVSAPSTSA